MNRAVEFEDNRRLAARARRGLAASVILAALAMTACERSKVEIDIYWEEGAVTPTATKLSVVFEYTNLPDGDPNKMRVQETTGGKPLPSSPPLTLIYWLDDPNRSIKVHVRVLGQGDVELLSDARTWNGSRMDFCVGSCAHCGTATCSATHDDGGAGAGPDASGGKGGAAVGGQPGSGGAGGTTGAGGERPVASGGAGGNGAGGKPIITSGGHGGGEGGKGAGGMPIGPSGGSKGQGGTLGSGGVAVGGSPGNGGSSMGGMTSTGGATATGGAIGTGGAMGTGGAPPPPSCLTDATAACSCKDYCDATASHCSSSGYFLPGASPSPADCLASCAGFHWTPGINDPSMFGDTIGCRVAMAIENRCLAASPSGGNICGIDRCITYCGALDRNCSGMALHPFPNGDCIPACMRSPSLTWDTTQDKLATMSAPTEYITGECRLFWAGQAGTTTDKATACKNAGPMSTVCR